MAAPTFRIRTLGCRVNHAEAREIDAMLCAKGLRPARATDAAADLEVIHTCSVTEAAAAKSRNALRRALRRGAGRGMSRLGTAAVTEPVPEHGETPLSVDQPDNRHSLHHNHAPEDTSTVRPEVVVTGCLAGTDFSDTAAIAGDAERVFAHADSARAETTLVERLSMFVDAWLDRNQCRHTDQKLKQPIRRARQSSSVRPIIRLPAAPAAAHRGKHIRAELKIQDGCDAHCTFCIIPKIRRTLRSKPIVDAVAEARRLVDLGHPEIVFCGIFMGAYGHETALRRKQQNQGAQPLADLLDAVAQVPGLQRLRFSSLEPGDVTGPLLDAMVANRPVVVPHLHLPLQSGSDAILRPMNRQYRVGEYLDMIDQVNDALTADGLPPAITTDIICGFPGETENDFQQTVDIARRVGYLHMHVFPYSPRTGTAAARWADKFVPDQIKKQRVRQLIDLEEDPHNGLAIAYRRQLLGRDVRIILEQPSRDDRTNANGEHGMMTGRCDHYAQIAVRSNQPRGTVLKAKVTEVTSDIIIAEPAAANVRLPVVA